MQFYLQTGGPTTWLRNDNWLVGEPCENGWFGVVCCPETYPYVDESGRCHSIKGGNGTDKVGFNPPGVGAYLGSNPVGGFLPRKQEADADLGGAGGGGSSGSSGGGGSSGSSGSSGGSGGGGGGGGGGSGGSSSSGRALQAAGAGPSPPPPVFMQVAPFGCRSGVSYGIEGGDADRTRCRVVALQLASNNLTGTLVANTTGSNVGNVLCPLHHIQVLSLGDNWLTGEFPNDVTPRGLLNPSSASSVAISPAAASEPGSGDGAPGGGESVSSYWTATAGACLPMLRHLDVEDNMLTGKLPHFIQETQIQWARFGSSAVENAAPNTYKGNNLEYPNLGTTAGKLEEQKYEETFRKCLEKQTYEYPYGATKTSATAEIVPARTGGCTGFPGSVVRDYDEAALPSLVFKDFETCDAFGGQRVLYVPKSSARSKFRCAECPTDWTGIIAATIGLFFFTFVCLLGYAYLVSKKMEATQMFVSSFSIIWYHAVTVSIIGSIRLNWPPNVKVITSSLSVTSFGFEVVDPKCVLRGPNAYDYFTISRLGVIFALLSVTSITSTIVSCCCSVRLKAETRKMILDRLDFLQSVIFAMQMTSSVRTVIEYLAQYEFGDWSRSDRPVQRVGLVLVITLVSYEVFVLLKFALVMWKLKTEGAFKLVGLTPQRLKRRLNYMTNRFSTYAQFHWQFVIWLRLVLLIFISLLPKILEAVQRTAQGTSLLTAEQIKKEEAQLESTIWFHAAIAMVVIAIFGLWSARVAPYRWRFQNIIENSLFVCDILAIALGMAYTLLNQQQKDFAETVSSNVIEFLLVVTLFGSMGVALVVVIVKHRRDVAQRQEEEAEQEIKDEYRSEATDGMTRENVQRLARTNEKIVLRRRPSQQIIGRGIQRGLGGVKGILGGRAARPDDKRDLDGDARRLEEGAPPQRRS